MSLLTTRLGIKKPQDPDPFLTSDFQQNYDLIDSYPGVFVCTQGTRPVWGAAQAGQMCFATDTRTLWEWTGSAWREPLVSPGAWMLNTTISTSVSGSSSSTYTVGTFTSSRPCSALLFGNLDFTPPQVEYDTNVNFVLKLNGTDLTTFGGGFTKQGVYISSTGIPYGTPNSILGFASASTVNAGSNTVSIKVNVTDNDVYSGGSTSVNLSSASVALIAVNNSTT